MERKVKAATSTVSLRWSREAPVRSSAANMTQTSAICATVLSLETSSGFSGIGRCSHARDHRSHDHDVARDDEDDEQARHRLYGRGA